MHKRTAIQAASFATVIMLLITCCSSVSSQKFSFPEEVTQISGRSGVSKRNFPPLNQGSSSGGNYNTNGGVPDTSGYVSDADPPSPDQVPPGQCICVPYYQCKEGFVLEDGGGLLDARKKKPPKKMIPLDGIKGRQGGSTGSQCPGLDQVCCKEPSAQTERPFEARCGVRNDNGINSRILTRNDKGEAEFGEWPWQVAVLKYANEQLQFECGGTLIANRYVLTVAHCVTKFLGPDGQSIQVPLRIRLGEWDTAKETEFLKHVDLDVSRIIIHPQYRNSSLWNDLAVVELASPVAFQPHISPICLPVAGEAFEGHDCVVTGWGKNAYRSGTYSNIMKEVTVPIIDNYNCQEMLRKTRLGQFYRLHDGFICAGAEGKDSCKGDGGGPLGCYRTDGRYILAGLVAWGIDCGTGAPGVYVRMTKYLDWISSVTNTPLTDFYP